MSAGNCVMGVWQERCARGVKREWNERLVP